MKVNWLSLAVIGVAIALPYLSHGEGQDSNDDGRVTDTDVAQPSAARPAARPDAEAKKDPVEPIDEDMLPDIGEDIQLGPDGEPLPDDQLGGDADPVTRIAEKMRRVELLLRKEAEQTDPHAEPLQQQIVQELDELIKALQKKSQQQSPSGKSSSAPQQNSRSKIKQPSQRPTQPSNKRDGNSKKPSRDSSERLGKAAAKVDLAEMAELIKDIWGHLPEKDRERLRQSSGEEVMPGHDVAVEKYFRRLAEETND